MCAVLIMFVFMTVRVPFILFHFVAMLIMSVIRSALLVAVVVRMRIGIFLCQEFSFQIFDLRPQRRNVRPQRYLLWTS